MTDGHRTSTIQRPPVNGAPRRGWNSSESRFDERFDDSSESRSGERFDERIRDPDSDDSAERNGILKDFTSPIPRSKQIVAHGHGRLIAGVFATVIALAIGAALFVLPVKSWFKQRDALQTRVGELKTLDSANNQLQSEVDRLQTTEGIREAAREEIDYVPTGEKRVTVLPVGAASTALPDGWPYNLVNSIIALRQADIAPQP